MASVPDRRQSKTRDMTSGPITRQLILFALPLMLGNAFQMLYNTVDSIVVGQFVGTQALAAVGSTMMIVNMLVFFFNGFATGAGVIIGMRFGAREQEALHDTVETTIAATFALCLLFTAVGTLAVKPMLRLMATPEDVFGEAVIYLRIYFAGISGLLVYNIGSGILRAVGDSTHPLYFLVFTSLLNIALDLLFVLAFHLGIAGVAWATVLAQLISALLTLGLLTRSNDIYRLTWRDLHINRSILRAIFAIGLPAGFQSMLTAFSNTLVQAYINSFGSACMAGWSTYNKLDQFIMLPMQSMSMAATTFVSQNVGAGAERRADHGTVSAISLIVATTAGIAALLFAFAAQASRLFTADEAVVAFSVLFMRTNVFFLIANSVNHTLAGALRGRGDSRGPMVIMLLSFVAIRQTYLALVTRFVANTPALVGFGYPVGWASCCIIELCYFFVTSRRRRSNDKTTA